MKEKALSFGNQLVSSGLYDESDIRNDLSDIVKMITMRMPNHADNGYDIAYDRAEEYIWESD